MGGKRDRPKDATNKIVGGVVHPRKRYYRARAHNNPFNDEQYDTPASPSQVDWSVHYPAFITSDQAQPLQQQVEIVDVGCGFGGMTLELARLFPTRLVLGLELRDKVVEYVHQRILASRRSSSWTIISEQQPDSGVLHNLHIQSPLPRQQLNAQPPTATSPSQTCADQHLLDQRKPRAAGNENGAAHSSQEAPHSPPVTNGLARALGGAGGHVDEGGQAQERDWGAEGCEGVERVDGEEGGEQSGALKPFSNASVMRLNAMRFLPNVFHKGQLRKMLFLFPDPHFKVANHRRRIISMPLLDVYAYLLREKGRVYIATDVRELQEWMEACLDAHPSFLRLSYESLGWPQGWVQAVACYQGSEVGAGEASEADLCVPLLTMSSEEAQKVKRNKGETFQAVYERV